MSSVYLDYNATAPIRSEAAQAVARALTIGGNPSSVHGAGRKARAAVELARIQVAALVGAPDEAVTFTSGGTEANALAIESAFATGVRRPLIGLAEHASVMENTLAGGHVVEGWPVTADGVADLDWLAARLKRWTKDDGPVFAALSLANNETGVIQPVAEAAALIHEAGGRLHVDAVQAAGKIAVDMGELDADTLALSGHKLGGPQGVGALLLADGDTDLRPHQRGGGQERGRRAGTENLPGIAGFAAAARLALAEQPRLTERLERLRRQLEDGVLAAVPAVRVIGERAPRLPNTSCLALPGLTAGTAVMMMDLAGVAISAGSACSSGKVAPSHVLTAMGAGILAGAAIRASLGWASREEEVTAFVAAFAEMASRAGRLRRDHVTRDAG
jgi:cysteine desulfurase